MKDDIIINKTEIIKRCIKRVQEDYGNNPENLHNYTLQDAIMMNIQRLCEASIDIAMHCISFHSLGVPQSSKDCFEILEKAKIIEPELSSSLQAMVGFRNIAVHEYQNINIKVVQAIIEKHLVDGLDLANAIFRYKQ